MSTFKKALQRIALEIPEARRFIIPLLQRHASCACGDEMVAGDLDEMFAGRKYDPGPGKQKPYGPPYSSVEVGKWAPKQKGKCFYETGDEGDRCYTTTHGGPGGPKPDTGSSKNRKEYNKKYRQQRWDMRSAEAQKVYHIRLAELRTLRAAQSQDEKMYAKGYRFKITFNSGKPAPLYVKDKGQAAAVQKDHGKGKVTPLKSN